MHKPLLAIVMGSFLLVGACETKAPAPAAPPPPPPQPAAQQPPPKAAAAAADGGSDDGGGSKLAPAVNDGLSLAERMAKREADENKLAAELAAEEKNRLLTYDKGKLKNHASIFKFTQKLRKSLDDLADKAKDAPDRAEQIGKLVSGQTKAVGAQLKAVQAIDPKGGNSNLVTDHDVMLNALIGDYATALGSGDEEAIKEYREDFDNRFQKIEKWMAEAEAFKPAKK